MFGTIIVAWNGVLTEGEFPEEFFRQLNEKYGIAEDVLDELYETLLPNYELGKMTSEEFFVAIIDKAGLTLSSKEIQELYNATLKPDNETIKLIKGLSGAKLLLIANCTKEVATTIEEEWGLKSIFAERYYSFEQGVRKQEGALFEKIKGNLTPEDTVYIDLPGKNILVAERHGIATIQYEGSEQLKATLNATKQ